MHGTSQPRPRTDAERRALGAAVVYARRHDLGTPAERPYLAALPPARRDVRDRFVAGLLRGSPAGLPEPTFLDAGDDPAAALPFDAADPPPVDGRLAVLPLPGADRALAAPVASVLAFDRVRVGDPVRLVGPEATRRLAHPVDLVAPLERAGAVGADQAETVRAEVAESVANLALALLAERVQADRAPADVLEAPAERLPAADRPAYLERLVTRGHPLHPAAKIRRGMSPAEGLAYAPEFAPRVDLRFVAVRADVARRTAVDDRTLTDRLFAAFDGLEAATREALPAAVGGYAVVPVHPWQYHRVLPERYDGPLADGRVVPVEGYHAPATPLLNLRTVVPDVDGTAPHVKLPIGVRTTNVERTLSPQAVHNGPRVTRLWRALGDREGLETLGLLEERAAASYYPPGGPHLEGDGYDDARHLGALLRRNPRDHPLAGGDARPVPAASLTARSPAGGRPLVVDVLERYRERTGRDDDAARAFLSAYLEAVVPPQLRLLCEYGVALESHLQNCVVVLEGWRPTAVLVRDFGGIRVLEERLAPRGPSFEPYPDSDLEADGAADLHRKLYYALVQNHLAELVATLVEETPLERDDAWAEVRAVCLRTFDRLRADGDVPEARVEADAAALLADPVPYKALTAMRLRGRRHEYVTSRVSNPLAARDGAARE